MKIFTGATLAFIALIFRIALRIAAPATFVLMILAFVGVVAWSLVLGFFLATAAFFVLYAISYFGARIILG